MISDELADLESRKVRVDEKILAELEEIRMLKDFKKKEKRYRALHQALKEYDQGILSLIWRIKKRLGIFDF